MKYQDDSVPKITKLCSNLSDTARIYHDQFGFDVQLSFVHILMLAVVDYVTMFYD